MVSVEEQLRCCDLVNVAQNLVKVVDLCEQSFLCSPRLLSKTPFTPDKNQQSKADNPQMRKLCSTSSHLRSRLQIMYPSICYL